MAEQATVTLSIENHYDDGETIPTVVENVVLPLPIPLGSDERESWEYEFVHTHTGTGKTDGDSWYDVEITTSTAPELIGMTFAFGY